MKKLEDFVRSHRDDFDLQLPSLDTWDKIEAKMAKEERGKFKIWKVSAAVAAVLVLALAGTFLLNQRDNNKIRYADIQDPVMKNLLETEAFYAKEVSEKINEIRKCYHIYPELKMDIEDDLLELDQMYQELQHDLNDNFYNREVIEAMIQNNRLRLEMVDRVLDQINC
ncbi:MAG TPA: hypothetical protein PLK12_04630 [Prolixibacteraceae bacterium]|nr:hypothetical protein [Prolixibacteraceae bacterium]